MRPNKVLIREICNSIIAQAVRYINGSDIFTMISSEETVECYAKLENTYRICTAFKAGAMDMLVRGIVLAQIRVAATCTRAYSQIHLRQKKLSSSAHLAGLLFALP